VAKIHVHTQSRLSSVCLQWVTVRTSAQRATKWRQQSPQQSLTRHENWDTPLFCVIGVARILSGGALFLTKKSDDLFFSRRPQRTSKYISKSNPPSKNCPKNWLLLWLGGALRVLGGALTHFPCKLRLKKNFSPPSWGAGAPTAPPDYAYVLRHFTEIDSYADYVTVVIMSTNGTKYRIPVIFGQIWPTQQSHGLCDS